MISCQERRRVKVVNGDVIFVVKADKKKERNVLVKKLFTTGVRLMGCVIEYKLILFILVSFPIYMTRLLLNKLSEP